MTMEARSGGRRRLAGVALALAVAGAETGFAASCHEIWDAPANQLQIIPVASVANPRSLNLPLPATANADSHLTFTGTTLSSGGVNPTDHLVRYVQQVNLSAVHGVRFDGKPLRLKFLFGPEGPVLGYHTVMAAPATVGGDDNFTLGVDAAELWISSASDLMLDLCVAVGGRAPRWAGSRTRWKSSPTRPPCWRVCAPRSTSCGAVGPAARR